MTHKLLHLAQIVININTSFFLGMEGALLGAVLFTSLLLVMRRQTRKAARVHGIK